jgi:hypothetical protein
MKKQRNLHIRTRQAVGVFPGAPAGILFPTDPGVPRTLAPPGNLDFAPRIGLAYSPEAGRKALFWAKVLGGPGKTSIRAGFGMYYTAIEALTIGILAGNAPFGITYSSPAPPLFATPFITASTGQFQGQPFPVALVTQAGIPQQSGLRTSIGRNMSRSAASPDMPRRTESPTSRNTCCRWSGNSERTRC